MAIFSLVGTFLIKKNTKHVRSANVPRFRGSALARLSRAPALPLVAAPRRRAPHTEGGAEAGATRRPEGGVCIMHRTDAQH